MVTEPASTRRIARPDAVPAALLSAVIALIGWTALGIEFDRSMSLSLAKGQGWAEALFLYFRFFTNLTNIGIAVLMTISAVRIVAGRRLPRAPIFNAGLIYIVVTCVTYEWLLRGQWKPSGVQFFTDLAVHDVVPALTLVFWLAFAPRHGARWRDALWMLIYPAIYFITTIVAGAFGMGYPYDFLDVDALGLGSVIVIGIIFIVVFYGLGLATTAVAMARSPERQAQSAKPDGADQSS